MGASISLSLGGSPGEVVRYGLAPRNPDRLILRGGRSALARGAWLIVLSLAIAMGGTSPHPVGWALLALPASLFAFWCRWAILDRKRGVVEQGSGALFPFWVRRTPLQGAGAVVLTRTERVRSTKSGSTVTTVYEVCLEGACRPVLLGSSATWEGAVQVAEVAAFFLGLPLRDRHRKSVRAPGELDEPLAARPDGETGEPAPAAAPSAGSPPKKTFLEWIEGDARRFRIPRPREHKFLAIAALAFLLWTLPVSCFGNLLFGLLPLLFLIPAWLWTAFGFSAEIEASPRGLTILTRGLVLRKTIRIPREELEDLVVETPERGGLREVLHDTFPGFLVARSDRASARFGYGLSREALFRLRLRLLQALAGPGGPGAPPALPPPPPDPPLPVLYRPYWPLAGLALGALAGHLGFPARNPCLSLPFLEHVLCLSGLVGLASAAVLEPRPARGPMSSRGPRWILASALFALAAWMALFPFGRLVSPWPVFPERAMLFAKALRADWPFLFGLVPAGFAAALALWAAVGGLVRAAQLSPALLRWAARWAGRTASLAWRHRMATAAVLIVIASTALLLSRNRLFFWAAREGNTAAVEVMTGASPALARYRDDAGSTPLHEACERGRVGTAQALLEAGADLNARDALDRTPLHRAVSNPTDATVRFLLGRGARVNERDRFGRTPLLLACQCNSAENARALLEGGADPDLADHDGQTPLRASVRNASLITLLLDRGADPEEGGKTAWLPLHAAVSFGEKASVEALLKGGASPNCRDSGGNTPLHEVACSANPGAVGIARLLLDGGADPSLVNKTGQTALQKAQGQCPGTPVVEFLHALGAPGLPLEEPPQKQEGAGGEG